MDINKMLIRFLKNNGMDVFKTLCQYGLFNYIFPENELYKGATENQKSFNEACLKELRKITNLFDKRNIKYAVLKGLPLAYELYENPNIRYSGDIDILVSKSQVKEVLNVFNELEYIHDQESGRLVNEDILDYDFRIIFGYHAFCPFNKQVFIGENKAINMEVDLHLYPCQKTFYEYYGDDRYYMIDVDGLLDRVEVVEIEGLKIRILDLNNRFLHLIIHYGMHLLTEFRANVYNMQSFDGKLVLGLIYDVVRFYDLHKKDLDNEYIIRKSLEWDVFAPLCTAVWFIDKIFPGLLDKPISEILYKPLEIKNPIDIYHNILTGSSIKTIFSNEYFDRSVKALESYVKYNKVHDCFSVPGLNYPVIRATKFFEDIYLGDMNISFNDDGIVLKVPLKVFSEACGTCDNTENGLLIVFYAKSNGFIKNGFSKNFMIRFNNNSPLLYESIVYDRPIDNKLYNIKIYGDYMYILLKNEYFGSGVLGENVVGFTCYYTNSGMSLFLNDPFKHDLIRFYKE